MGSAGSDYRLGKLKGQPVVTWWENGRRKRFRLRNGINQAETRAELARFVKSRELVLDRGDKTVADIVRLYIKDRELDGKSTAKQEFSWKALAPHFGHLRPGDISKDACNAYRDSRMGKGRRAGTIWTEMSVLRAALNWAVKAKKIPEAPFIWLGDQPPPKERHLTRDEADQLVSELRMPHIKLFVRLALGTAARAGALFALKWSKVDFDRRQIDLRQDGQETNKRRAIVPMNDTLYDALKQAKEGALTPFVLEWSGHPINTVKGAFKRAAARCGWVDVTPHTLRHTAAVWMVEAGVPLGEVSQYLGHTSVKVTERVYARYSPTHLRKAAAALEV